MNIQSEIESLNNNISNFINLDGIILPFNDSENKMHMSCSGGCSSSCSSCCSSNCSGCTSCTSCSGCRGGCRF